MKPRILICILFISLISCRNDEKDIEEGTNRSNCALYIYHPMPTPDKQISPVVFYAYGKEEEVVIRAKQILNNVTMNVYARRVAQETLMDLCATFNYIYRREDVINTLPYIEENTALLMKYIKYGTIIFVLEEGEAKLFLTLESKEARAMLKLLRNDLSNEEDKEMLEEIMRRI